MLIRSTTAALARSRLSSVAKPNCFRAVRISPIINANLTTVDFRGLSSPHNRSLAEKWKDSSKLRNPKDVMWDSYFYTIEKCTLAGGAVGVVVGVSDAILCTLLNPVFYHPISLLPACVVQGVAYGIGGALTTGFYAAFPIGVPVALTARAITAMRNRSINNHLFSPKAINQLEYPSSEAPKEESATHRP